MEHTPLEAVYIFFDTATYDEIARDVKVGLTYNFGYSWFEVEPQTSKIYFACLRFGHWKLNPECPQPQMSGSGLQTAALHYDALRPNRSRSKITYAFLEMGSHKQPSFLLD